VKISIIDATGKRMIEMMMLYDNDKDDADEKNDNYNRKDDDDVNYYDKDDDDDLNPHIYSMIGVVLQSGGNKATKASLDTVQATIMKCIFDDDDAIRTIATKTMSRLVWFLDSTTVCLLYIFVCLFM
jgi:hypothetical protein